MTKYRVSVFKTTSVRLYKVNGKRKTSIAQIKGKKAELVQKTLLAKLPLKEIIRFKHGLTILEADEEIALKIAIGLLAVNGLVNYEFVSKMLDAVEAMDKGEIYWWHSLYLKLGHKAIQSLRTAYI